jgi:hypothetical protein
MGASYLLWGASGAAGDVHASGTYAAFAVFALWFGLSYGGIVSLLPALCMDLFGARALASVIGTLYSGAALGNLRAPIIVLNDTLQGNGQRADHVEHGGNPHRQRARRAHDPDTSPRNAKPLQLSARRIHNMQNGEAGRGNHAIIPAMSGIAGNGDGAAPGGFQPANATHQRRQGVFAACDPRRSAVRHARV